MNRETQSSAGRKSPKVKWAIISILIFIAVAPPLLIFLGTGLKAFNDGRRAAIQRNLGKTAEAVVNNIDQMQKFLAMNPEGDLPQEAKDAAGSSVLLGHETPQMYMDRNFGGGVMTIAGRDGADETTITLPDGRRFAPPEVISKGFRMDRPKGWRTGDAQAGAVNWINDSGDKRIQVMWRDVHRGEEERAKLAWIDEWTNGLPAVEGTPTWIKKRGEWRTAHSTFYRFDAGGGGKDGWVSGYYFTSTDGRIWLIRTRETGADGDSGPTDDIQAIIQNFQPL